MSTRAAYLTSDWILVPVKPEYLSTIGLPLLNSSLREFSAHYDDHKLEVLGIVFNHASGYAPEELISKQEARNVAAQYGWYVFQQEVKYSRSYSKGAREGEPIFRTSYAHTSQSSQFHAFAVEFAARIGL